MELLGQNKVDHRQRKVAIVSQDCFYKVLTPEQKAKALKGQYNFDHPGIINLQKCFCLSSVAFVPLTVTGIYSCYTVSDYSRYNK